MPRPRAGRIPQRRRRRLWPRPRARGPPVRRRLLPRGGLCYKSPVDALTISIVANIVLGFVLFGLLYRKRWSDSEGLTRPEQALARYRIRYPTASGHASLAADGRAALLELSDGTVGLIERCGRRWSVRLLEPREILGVDRAGDGAIVIRFADFGWPRARVQLSDPDTCRRWIERLIAMREAVASARERRLPRA
jgi:hypothetical protein